MKPHSRLIMGKNCLTEVLRSFPERIEEVFTVKTNASDSLYKDLQKKRIPIKHLSKQELSQLVNSTSHQSYIAQIKNRNHVTFEEIADTNLVLMLDSIFDPHNFGAILRAAECFGVDCVVYSKNRGTDVTPVVSKVSSGASELVPLMRVSNLAETAKLFKDAGFSLVAADVGEGSQSLYTFEFPEKTLLILGSEGEGIQNLLRKKSDYIINIPMAGQIDSINVSQAATTFLFSYRTINSLNV